MDSQNVVDMKLTTIKNEICGRIMVFEDDKFAVATVGKASKKTSANDFSIVKDEEVAGVEKIGEIPVEGVGELASLAV